MLGLSGIKTKKSGEAVLNNAETRLLIISCSGKKRSDSGLLPAVDRYRPGAYYQILHSVPREHWPMIIILSARYGFLSPSYPLPNYDQEMDKARAFDLVCNPQTTEQLATLIPGNISDVFVAGGKLYRQVIDHYRDLGVIPDISSWRTVQGGIGVQRNQLKQWLVQGTPQAEVAN